MLFFLRLYGLWNNLSRTKGQLPQLFQRHNDRKYHRPSSVHGLVHCGNKFCVSRSWPLQALHSDVTFSAQNPNFNPSVSYDHYIRDCAASSPHPPTLLPTSVPPTTLPQTTVPPTTPLQTSAPPSSIFSFCVDNTDCAEILDAEWRFEKCQCLPGLSHGPAQNSCIQGRLLKMETLSLNIHRVILTVAGLTL